MSETTNPKQEPQSVVSSTVVTNTDQSMISKSIEAQADGVKAEDNKTEKKKSFMTKKKLIFAIVFIVLSIALLCLTVRYVLKIEWNEFFKAVGSAFDRKIGVLWFFMLLFAGFINVLRSFITFMPRIRSLGCKISFGEYLIYGITVCFLGQVTPASLIIDPYTIFWMKTHGISTSKCMSILFTNTFFWQIIQIVLTAVPVILLLVHRDQMFAYTRPGAHGSVVHVGQIFFALIIIGCIIDILGLITIFLMCVSKRFHYRISVIFNWFKKKFHMKYHTKPEIEEKYKEKAVIKNDFYNFMKDWKTTLTIVLLFAVGDILATLAFGWSIAFAQYTTVELVAGGSEITMIPFDYGWMFTVAKLSVPANRLNLLPGAAMLYEESLSVLSNALGGWKPLPDIYKAESVVKARETVTNNGIFIARCFTGYVPALVGIGGFITLTVQQFRLSKQGHLIESKY